MKHVSGEEIVREDKKMGRGAILFFSCVSFLLSLLCVVESYATGTNISGEKKTLADEMTGSIVQDILTDGMGEPVVEEVG